MISKVKKASFNFVKNNFGEVAVSFIPLYILIIVQSIISGTTQTTTNGVEYHSNPVGTIMSILVGVLTINFFVTLFRRMTNPNAKLGIGSSFEGLGKNFFPILLVNMILNVVIFAIVFAVVFIGLMLTFISPIFFLVMIVAIFFIFYIFLRLNFVTTIAIDILSNFSGRYNGVDTSISHVIGLSFKDSWKLTKGRTMEIFLLYLSLIGWYLLIIVTLGLAFIFVLPYVTVIEVNLYSEFISGQVYPSLKQVQMN